MTRFVLELQEPDGRLMAEVLVHADDADGLVDDNGRRISYGRTIALCGRKWRVQRARLDATIVRIACMAIALEPDAERMPESRFDHERVVGDGVEASPLRRSQAT